MKIDTDLILCIIAICAIASPVLVTFLNNRHDYSLKKLELYNKNKQKIIFDFLDSIGHCTDGEITIREKENFQQSLNKLLLYFPYLDTSLINKIYDSIFITNTKDKTNTIIPLIKELSKSIREK